MRPINPTSGKNYSLDTNVLTPLGFWSPSALVFFQTDAPRELRLDFAHLLTFSTSPTWSYSSALSKGSGAFNHQPLTASLRHRLRASSRPELTGPLGLDDGHASASAGSASAPPVALITVTVSRKPTRAMCARCSLRFSPRSDRCGPRNWRRWKPGPRSAPIWARYHVSDTTDVAFLIARLAREIRQAKQARMNRERRSRSGLVTEPRIGLPQTAWAS